MKILTASLATETNVFSPIPTGKKSFEEAIYFRHGATHVPGMFFTEALHVWKDNAQARNIELVESLAACAQPAGLTVRQVYEECKQLILDDVKNALPLDMILLSMHGAMAAAGYPDCEGDLIQSIREIVGKKTVIGVEFDPHAHLTDDMLESGDCLIFYKEYPHIDIKERAEELFEICLNHAKGKIQPHMVNLPVQMLGIFETPKSPMKEFVERMQAFEKRDDVLSVSFVHGFPWGDHEQMGAQVLVVTDNNTQLGQEIARELGKEIWQIREHFAPNYPNVKASLKVASEIPEKPLVIADMADNAGGGAPSDSTFFLSEILEQKLKNVAVATIYDPEVVRLCQEAGTDAEICIRVGGKLGVTSGQPLDLNVKIHSIIDKTEQSMGPSKLTAGTSVWLETDGVHLIVNNLRTQTFSPDMLELHGIDLKLMDIVIVKSTQHFYDAFAPIASRIIHAVSPGALNFDYASIPYERSQNELWPAVENPKGPVLINEWGRPC
ncbi:M81 family metallopeptidase [uncultured Paraglaciecola sp.]|uniref:M81 family metallopeptidase n=1 Tax=uncultured Paraglaciecola sp. TaxID=1765024 RepID=UPI0025999FE8|nr:M81 family metallopeptidase [uncultured Paraglaciecola sp.]